MMPPALRRGVPYRPAWGRGGRICMTRNLSTLGIRKEDPKRVWERRAPLTPKAVAQLLREGRDRAIAVEVESCQRRCFPDRAYAEVGAQVVPKLSASVDLVMGIKEPPVSAVSSLIQQDPTKKRTWMVFSHTHKGQPYNVPLLSAFMDPGRTQTLVDYELMTAPSGADGELKRVAAFGWYAGAVGAGEALSMTGLALLRRGMATPLLQLSRPYTFSSLEAYKAALSACGDQIRASSAASSVSADRWPVVIGLTGAGNVSTGAKEMLDAAGVNWIQAEQLKASSGSLQTNQIYACHVRPSDILIRIDGSAYDRSDYRGNPGSYRSIFSAKMAPYLTTLINGAGWQSGFPRLMTTEDLSRLTASGHAIGPQKLVAIQDIACDLNGGLEFLDRHTTIDEPFYEGPGGVLISSTDILPTELPTDASAYFSSKILPYVKYQLLGAQATASHSSAQSHSDTIRRATIVRDGELDGTHVGLHPSVTAWRSGRTAGAAAEIESGEPVSGSGTRSSRSALLPQRKKKVLLLGSGLVAGPAVEVLSARSDIQLSIASNNLSEATSLAARFPNADAFSLDISDAAALSSVVESHAVVISLLPAPLHVQVAEHCLRHRKHLVTASYISPEMKALDQRARDMDVVLLGECGLDPGIDSMAAMRILDRVKRERKRVTSFVSWCGGLPEPGASNVPLGYKFSWSPKAVLTAALNDARYKLDGKVQAVPGDELLAEHFPDVELWKGLALEGLANRDSLPYAEKYGLGQIDGLKDLFRGTLRYRGFSRLLDSFRRMGLLDVSPPAERAAGRTAADFVSASLASITGHARGGQQMSSNSVRAALNDLLGSQAEETISALDWLGMLPSSRSQLDIPAHLTAPIDILAYTLSHKLAYEPHQRDSCLLHHAFELQPLDGDRASSFSPQRVTASLLHYGSSRASSMSTTVGKTLAFAALRVLDGEVRARGVMGPYDKEVWQGVLQRLEDEGVRVEETWA